MEDAFASICSGILVLGYGALCYGVGSFASKQGWSFGTFFVLALLFNPVFMFVVVVVMSAVTDADEADASPAAVQASSGAEARSDQQKKRAGGTGESRDQASSTGAAEPFSDREADEPNDGADSVSGDDSPASDSPPGDDRSSSDESVVEGDSLEETYNEDTRDRKKEGKVRCDTCYSFVDESASECPACGTPLDSGGGFSLFS